MSTGESVDSPRNALFKAWIYTLSSETMTFRCTIPKKYMKL